MSKRLTGLLSAALVALPLTLWAAPIQTVDVSVQTGTGRLAPSVADRIEASVKVIGERVLVGQPSETVAAHAGEYGKVLADVAGRVISGYVVTDVEVRADAATRLVLVRRKNQRAFDRLAAWCVGLGRGHFRHARKRRICPSFAGI